MNPHILEKKTVIRRSRSELFDFFSNAGNLNLITPPELGFRIITTLPLEMKEGALIEYVIRLNGIPFKWKTEITKWDPPNSFTDTQLKGPYRMWVHEHIFEDKGDTTLMTDIVRYLSPGGPFEIIPHKLFVERKVREIFDFREKRFNEIFKQ